MNNDKAESFTPKFYKHVDSPVMILFFDADDIAIGFIVMWILLVLSLLFSFQSSGIVYLYMLLSIVASVFYSKFKKNKPKGYIYQFLYKTGVYHPSSSLSSNKYKKYSNNFKVVPYSFTKKMKGQ